MVENNNKEVINRLAKKSFKANKGRNTFAIMAIALTTVLFTALFTISISMNKSFEYSEMRRMACDFHGGIKEVSEEQYSKLIKHKSIKKYGRSVFLSVAENKELIKRQTEIKSGDKNFIEGCFASPTIGKLPEKKDEVLIDKITLKNLGVPEKIGQYITIKYKVAGQDRCKNLKVCGIYKGDIASTSSILYVTEDLVKEEMAGIDLMKTYEDGTGSGWINLEMYFSNQFFIEDKLIRLVEDCGYNPVADPTGNINDLNIGVSWSHSFSSSWEESIYNLLMMVGLLIIIILSGYLIIYNVFYISVAKDIKFYGLLKTIGTTKKQIKKIITKQALILSAIGIPIGIIIGYISGVLIFPKILSTTVISDSKISVSPLIFIVTIIFSLVTVLISTRKPAKIASKVSPIEAVRYTEAKENKKNKSKKRINGAKLNKMALSNIFRNKIKALAVIASLSISIIILNTAYSIVSSFNKDEYIKSFIGSDFTLGDEIFYRWGYGCQDNGCLTEKICKEFEEVDGVKKVNKMYFNEMNEMPLTDKAYKYIDGLDLGKQDSYFSDELKQIKKTKKILFRYYGFDDGIANMLNKYLVEGSIDKDKLKTGEYIIVQDSYELGRIVSVGDKLTVPTKDGQTKEYTVMAVINYDIPLYLYVGNSTLSICGYFPTEEFKNIIDTDSVMTAMFDVKDEESRKRVDAFIKTKIKENPTLSYRSKQTYENQFNKFVQSYKLVGYSLSFILGIIGILNFTNVIITSIISRRKEFAMLRSIGMTNQQLLKMIVNEGLYYAIITVGVVIILGLPITYFATNVIAGGTTSFVYKFTILPIIITCPILILIASVIPKICIKYFSNDNVVEAIRESE